MFGLFIVLKTSRYIPLRGTLEVTFLYLANSDFGLRTPNRTSYFALRASCLVLRASCYVHRSFSEGGLRASYFVLRASCYVHRSYSEGGLRASYFNLFLNNKQCRALIEIDIGMLPLLGGLGFDILCGEGDIASHAKFGLGMQCIQKAL